MNDKGGVNFTPKIFKTSFSSKGDKVILKHKYRNDEKIRAMLSNCNIRNDDNMIFSSGDIKYLGKVIIHLIKSSTT